MFRAPHHHKRKAELTLDNTVAENHPEQQRVIQWIADVKQNHAVITDQQAAENILQLTPKKFGRLTYLVNGLMRHDLLDEKSFADALSIASIKLPSVHPSSFVKMKQHTHGWTKITIDARFSFFLKRRASKQFKAGYHCVSSAYDSPDSHSPKWAVKWLWIHNDNQAAVLAAAKHEVRYLHCVGMQAFFYATKRSVKIVMEWYAGETLESLVTSNRINHYSFKTRLTWCLSILSTLKKVYDGFIVHGDLNRGNVIININTNEAVVIDYEMGRKMLAEYGSSYAYDGRMFACNYIKNGLFGTMQHASQGEALERRIIQELLAAMTDIGFECSIKQAHDYCKQVLEHFDRLTEVKLNEITNATLNRGELAVDDVLHGNKRPLLLI
jgi:hypothetical protein